VYLRRNRNRLLFLILSLSAVYYLNSEVTGYMRMTAELDPVCSSLDAAEKSLQSIYLRCAEKSETAIFLSSVSLVVKNILYLIVIAVFIFWNLLFSTKHRPSNKAGPVFAKKDGSEDDPFEAIRQKERLG